MCIRDSHEIVVDLLATSEVSVSLTVDPAPRLEAVMRDLAPIGEVTLREGRSIVADAARAFCDASGRGSAAQGAPSSARDAARRALGMGPMMRDPVSPPGTR